MGGMSEGVSIVLAIIGVLLELLAVFGLARLLDVQIPKPTVLLCAAVGAGILAIVVGGLIWGIEPILTAFLLLALVPATSLGACVILALVRWINSPSDSRRGARPPKSSRTF
jgi:hypothetical protein